MCLGGGYSVDPRFSNCGSRPNLGREGSAGGSRSHNRGKRKFREMSENFRGNVREFQGKCPVMEKSGIEGKVREKSGNLGKS